MRVFSIDDIEIELPDWLLGTAIEHKVASGDYEGSESHAARMRIKPGMRVLEVGAGLGYVSAICANLAGAEHVVSVEANPQMLAPLQANLARNGCKAVQVMHGALVGNGHHEETVNFRAGSLFWGGATLPNGVTHDDMVPVPALRLRPLLLTIRPRFVMLDVEGAEAELFKKPWPRFVKFVVLELHPKKYKTRTIKEIVDCMSASGLTYDPATSHGRTLGFMRV
ncbi:FkbM family methyltransferase [Cognatishimia maritima]|uniref:Methyltransferase, FkbM family n=1 Tax=Cognatishimia maritima TaxID=870908 RepID=A0A1M5K8M7_9RHOB|nr:FkbM family methyltransferase [Cognatishimia maritima]SHG49071.1 methyltransferase, FkbM family [Cognatishimia maritima]